MLYHDKSTYETQHLMYDVNIVLVDVVKNLSKHGGSTSFSITYNKVTKISLFLND